MLASALSSPTTEVVGVSIEDRELRAHFSSLYPQLAMFAGAEELYEKANPEAVVTCADNRRATEVAMYAMKHGLHVMKEKPFAADLTSARAMANEAERQGTRLMVNWKTSWYPALHCAKRLVDEGRIGRVIGVYHRDGHGGPPPGYANDGPVLRVGWGWLVDREANGGGAAVDFCCYGAAISYWLMGLPNTVQACGGNYAHSGLDVEDCGTMIFGYPRGHCVCEGTWAQPGIPLRLPTTIYGESGALALTGPSEVLVSLGVRGQLASTLSEPVVPDALPRHFRSGPDYFTYSLLHDEPFLGLASLEVSLAAQEMVEAGMRAMATGARVELPLVV